MTLKQSILNTTSSILTEENVNIPITINDWQDYFNVLKLLKDKGNLSPEEKEIVKKSSDLGIKYFQVKKTSLYDFKEKESTKLAPLFRIIYDKQKVSKNYMKYFSVKTK